MMQFGAMQMAAGGGGGGSRLAPLGRIRMSGSNSATNLRAGSGISQTQGALQVARRRRPPEVAGEKNTGTLMKAATGNGSTKLATGNSSKKVDVEDRNVNSFFAQWERRMGDARNELIEEEQTLRRHQRWREEEKNRKERQKAAAGVLPTGGQKEKNSTTSTASKESKEQTPGGSARAKLPRASSIPVFHAFDDDDSPASSPPPSGASPSFSTTGGFKGKRTSVGDFLNPAVEENHEEGRDAYEKMWRDHDTRWQAFQEEPPNTIRKQEVPWPPCEGDILEFTEKIWAPGHPRQAYRIACRRWHPDKFLQLYGDRIPEGDDRQAIEDALNGLIQSINQQWERQVIRSGIIAAH